LRGEGAQSPGAGFGAEPRRSAPGTSNTRRIAPKRSQSGGAKHALLRAPDATATRGKGPSGRTPVHCAALAPLGRRVDWLTTAFRGQLSKPVEAVLCERLAVAHELRTAVGVELAPGVVLALNAASRPGWWRLSNADVRVVVDSEASGGWLLEVTASALLLGRVGAADALACARGIATAVLAGVEEARVRRVDLCADFVGFDLGAIDSRAWVVPRRCGVEDVASLHEYRHAAVRTGFAIGKSAVRLRVYDKTEELRLGRNEGDKRDEEHARWRSAGWNGKDEVTRVEFQVRGDALTELELRDPTKLLERLDAVWAYCSRTWVRLVDLGTATRRARCRTQDRWRAVQAVTFARADGEVAVRKRSRAPARARLAFGVATNYAAGVGAITPFAVGSALDHVETWSEERSETFVRSSIVHVMTRAAVGAADDVVKAYGPRKAAAYVIERMNAACARTSCAAETLLERHAIEAPERTRVASESCRNLP
jgi:hypothetical protein